jgi:hypothetical protein
MIETMKLKLLGNIVGRLKARIRKQPETEDQKVLIAEDTIDNVLARHSENQDDVEELLDALIRERMGDIQEFDASLRNPN